MRQVVREISVECGVEGAGEGNLEGAKPPAEGGKCDRSKSTPAGAMRLNTCCSGAA